MLTISHTEFLQHSYGSKGRLWDFLQKHLLKSLFLPEDNRINHDNEAQEAQEAQEAENFNGIHD